MSGEADAAVVRRFYEDFSSRGDFAVADAIVAPDMTFHEPGRELRGPEPLKARVAQFRVAFPDLTIAIDDLVAADDRVVVRITLRGTHRGTFAGIAPTGQAVVAESISILRVADGQIVEGWASFDQLGMMQQLGAKLALPFPR